LDNLDCAGCWLSQLALGSPWDTLSKERPTIKISFDSGEGLQAAQSQLKYKDIVLGAVNSRKRSVSGPAQAAARVALSSCHQGREFGNAPRDLVTALIHARELFSRLCQDKPDGRGERSRIG
jgi:hypothetical protein